MTAMPIEPEAPRGWPLPPPGGYTADDLDTLPDLPAHTELIDGSLVFVSPQKLFHMCVVDFLSRRLRSQAPEHLAVCREMTVTIGNRQRPEPDVLVVGADAVSDLSISTFSPESVVLAVEVVSPDSMERDRKRKPQLYAEAGIPHFWRIENADDRAVVYVYELDPATNTYALTGIHHDALKLTVPFDIALDLTQATR